MSLNINMVNVQWKSNGAHCYYASHASLLDVSAALSELNARSDSHQLNYVIHDFSTSACVDTVAAALIAQPCTHKNTKNTSHAKSAVITLDKDFEYLLGRMKEGAVNECTVFENIQDAKAWLCI